MDSRTCALALLAAMIAARPCLPEESPPGKPKEKAPALSGRVAEALGWLPADTETVFVAQGPLAVPAVEKGEPSESFEEMLLFLGMGSLATLKGGDFLEPLEGQEVALSIEGSRRFRPPKGLGLMPYEGCNIVIFDKDLGKAGETLDASLKESAAKTDDLEGHTAHLFEVKAEASTWYIRVVRPRPNIVLSATNTEYLREVLARMKKRGEKRALPEDLPEWKHASTGARFWAIRHYDPKEAPMDPSSPLGLGSFFPDKEAVGLTFAFDPARERKARIVHLTANEKGTDVLSRVWRAENNQLKPEIQAHPGRVEVLVDVEQETVNLLVFVLLAVLGHGIFL